MTIWQLPCSNFDLTALNLKSEKKRKDDKFGFNVVHETINAYILYIIAHY